MDGSLAPVRPVPAAAEAVAVPAVLAVAVQVQHAAVARRRRGVVAGIEVKRTLIQIIDLSNFHSALISNE